MNDVDFEQFIKLLDGALASDDKNVKNALRKFLFVAALALGDDVEPGPFTQMMETIDNLQRRISTLEAQDNTTKYGGNNPWITTYPAIGTPGTTAGGTGTGWNSGTITSTGGTTYTNATTTSTNITATGSTGTVYYTLGDDKTGTKLKDSIKDKLKGLVKAA